MKAGDWVILNEAGMKAFPKTKGREGRVVFMRRGRVWVNWMRYGAAGPYRLSHLTIEAELSPQLAVKFAHVAITD